MRLLWLRHGQSTWNALGRLQGHTPHPPLTELGRQQAADAADQVAVLGARRIVSSPAVRARQTAVVVAARLGLPVHLDPRLVEQGLREDHASTLRRVSALVAELDPTQTTLLVTHGDVIALATGLGRCPGNGEVVAGEPLGLR
ncbi:MAG: phosphoglycerate mutase family protein [Aeromicrobium sp.]|uniref:histidine phosphatase family protein n=1 Tax=Aeromicrobium sp. TaxID=1871063 RepID=UPI0039E2C762